MMPTYQVTALDHQGGFLITHEHQSTRLLDHVDVHLAWRIGTIAVTGPCGCVLAVVALPAGHPSQQPPPLHIELEHTT